MKQTYRVQLPDNSEATRTTARTYTHVVAVQYKPEGWDVRNGKAKPEDWFVRSWCGRLDLAQQQQRLAVAAGYPGAKIVPLTQPGG